MDCSHAGNDQEQPEGDDEKEDSKGDDDDHSDKPGSTFPAVLTRRMKGVHQGWEARRRAKFMNIFEEAFKSLYKKQHDGSAPTDEWVQQQMQSLPQIRPALTVKNYTPDEEIYLARELTGYVFT
jgi:hypothetical protein